MKLPRIRVPSRERLLSTFGPPLLAVIVVGLFVLPNYLRAAEARRESRRVDLTANEQMLKRSQLVAIERDLARLRAEQSVRCRVLVPLGDDRLGEAIGRTIDGRGVRNQGVRLAAVEHLPRDAHRPLDLTRRTMTVELMGSFEAAFSVLDAAESMSQLVVPSRFEVALVRGASEDAATIRATIEFHGYFAASEGER